MFKGYKHEARVPGVHVPDDTMAEDSDPRQPGHTRVHFKLRLERVQ